MQQPPLLTGVQVHGMEPKAYMPHLSLLYSSIDDATRAQVQGAVSGRTRLCASRAHLPSPSDLRLNR